MKTEDEITEYVRHFYEPKKIIYSYWFEDMRVFYHSMTRSPDNEPFLVAVWKVYPVRPFKKLMTIFYKIGSSL